MDIGGGMIDLVYVEFGVGMVLCVYCSWGVLVGGMDFDFGVSL